MTRSLSKIVSIYCPFPSMEEAEKAAQVLLDEKLIACANILPPGRSLYVWDEKVQKESETFVFFKTSIETASGTIRRIEELHPYEVPAIIQFEAKANEAFADWINDSLGDKKHEEKS